MLLANNNTLMKLVYVNTKMNTLPDLLSRWYNGASSRRQFKSIMNNKMIRRSIPQQFFQFDSI